MTFDYRAFAVENMRREFGGKTMSYDTKCYDLAAAFLQDHPRLNTSVYTRALAQTIQDTIEDEINMWTEDQKLDDSLAGGSLIDPRD